MAASSPPSYGNRTLPQTLDDYAANTPNRLYAAIPKSRDLADGFIDITCRDMARCVNFMSHWITEKLGKSSDFETVAYIGIPDLRSVAVVLAGIKCGYKVLLPSPRNPPATNASLMQQTSCKTVLHTSKVLPVVKLLDTASPNLHSHCIPPFQEMLDSSPAPFPFTKSYSTHLHDPIIILHSSGSTGLPKPITMTHATFAVLDSERNLPQTHGRKNRDYSIWDLPPGSRFYTIFPYFHLAGFLSLFINPIFTEASAPVLGPPLQPPSGALLKEVMKHQKLRALYLPPSICEQLLQEDGGLEFFKGLDFLCYTGAPFSPTAGEVLSKVTELCPLYGSTEAFQVPQLAPAPEDWAWMEWNPVFKVDMQPCDDEPGTFELVLFADESTEKICALNHNLRGVGEYRTKDLFKQHPRKKGLWQYYGRRDDIVVLANGEKFNPVPMELKVGGNPRLMGALVTGMGRASAALLVEPKPNDTPLSVEELVEAIWPYVEEGNTLVPAQGRILRGNVIVSKPERPFIRAGKGTVVRKLTEALYKEEIDMLYTTEPAATQTKNPRSNLLRPVMRPNFTLKDVVGFVRGVIVNLFPELKGMGEDDDLFAYGLDSVMIGQFLNSLKTELRESSPGNDFEWLDTQVVYHNSSIRRLSDALAHYLNEDEIPKPTNADVAKSRVAVMNDMVRKYTQGLQGPPVAPSKGNQGGPRSVILIGSTGYVGPRVLAWLLANTHIETIYCLNRDDASGSRTLASLHSFPNQDSSSSSRIKFFAADLTNSTFGLTPTDYSLLSENADTIIYNAWRPNFNLPISSFEKPFVSAIRFIINLSLSSPKRPRIVFVSSFGAVLNWPILHPDNPIVPETPIDDVSASGYMGYGESKCVAERILQHAHKECGIPVDILRTGQIGGPGKEAGGKWAVQGWLLGIIKSSKALGVFPTKVAPVDWLSVDVLAQQIADVTSRHSNTSLYRVFNLAHPDVKSWDLFLDTLIHRFGIKGEKAGLPQWLEKLEAQAKAENVHANNEEYVALKFLPFLKSLGEGTEEMRFACEKVKEVSKTSVTPLNEDVLEGWLRGWEF
ncbi:acetyl-CoA synthetase-like protein [Byssothecium circinans]|uniref:Acetyl-CoA synthetase-like protein n=1 Tax=Byssothecium circinans TaxID=147558 RepID=A0A6A5TVG9_9PLEO|nr:acetyl-CoA synthetase-like protein [Byssothecium circinans]